MAEGGEVVALLVSAGLDLSLSQASLSLRPLSLCSLTLSRSQREVRVWGCESQREGEEKGRGRGGKERERKEGKRVGLSRRLASFRRNSWNSASVTRDATRFQEDASCVG